MATTASAPVHRSWSDLTPDCLEVMAKKIGTVSDFIRFRSVCRSWRSAAAPAYLPRHLPLMMLPSDPAADVRHFFSLSANKAFVVPLPESRGKSVLHSAGGWLLLYDPSTNDLSLLNPITRFYFLLPSASSLVGNGELKTWSAFLSSNTSSSSAASAEDCVVMLNNFLCGNNDVAFWKAGNLSWTVLETGLDAEEMIMSMAFFAGRFYSITQKGKVSVCNPAAPSRPSVVEFFPDMTSFTSFQFATTAEELLLVVGLGFAEELDEREKEYFVSLKLHVEDGFPSRVQIGGMDEMAVFMSNHQLMLLPAGQVAGCRAMHMYSSHFFYLRPYGDLEQHMDIQGIWLLNLENTNYEVKYTSCGWRIPCEALYEPRFILEPRQLAYAVRHMLPVSRWIALSLF